MGDVFAVSVFGGWRAFGRRLCDSCMRPPSRVLERCVDNNNNNNLQNKPAASEHLAVLRAMQLAKEEVAWVIEQCKSIQDAIAQKAGIDAHDMVAEDRAERGRRRIKSPQKSRIGGRFVTL